jgi:UPF0755 protein
VRRLVLGAVVVTVALVASVAGAAWWMRQQIDTPYQGFTAAEQFVDVPPGTPTAGIARRLVDAGVVADVWTFRVALWWTGQSRALKAGEYRFVGPSTPLTVVATLVEGRTFTQPLTFPEGLTLAEMAALFETRGVGTARDFLAAAASAAPIADLDPQARDLEGYLFPDTYPLSRRVSAPELVAMMVARFRAVWDEVSDGRDRGSLSVREVVVLASLVEKETAAAAERPLVAAVYTNRLRRKMGLQADPTVVYALSKAGRYKGNIRRVDLEINSPYNTYRYSGLPPGPIAAPGQAALEAALAPADVPYLFFVSRNDGSHAFAETLREHNANVQRFQVEYFRAAAARPAPRRADSRRR